MQAEGLPELDSDDRNPKIAQGLVDRDPVVLALLVDDYGADLRRYLRALSRDPQLADDLFQETWLRVGERGSQYNGEHSFKTWLFAIARNLVNDHLRCRQQRACLPIEKFESRPALTDSPEETLIQVEAQAELMAALAHLNERERDLLSLKFAAGLTNRRIAELSGLSEGNVGVIVYRALGHLRVILATSDSL